MKFLGIDYGEKRIGLATSDENNRLAFPKEIILNDKNVFFKIGEILKKERITEVVVGESLDFSGSPNIVSRKIDIFIFELKKNFKIKIHRQKEFLTSVEAHDRIGKELRNARQEKKPKTENLDARAAAIILQRFLDKYNNPRHGGASK